MNPNQMMIAKAMVAQTALREEAAESRRRRSGTGRSRTTRKDHHFLGLLRRR
jgi:predicted small integral membrane protein